MELNYVFKGTLVRVVDGDTVDAEIDLGFHLKTTQRLRLLRVDAPESRAIGSEERTKALAATARVAHLLGLPIMVKTQKTDSFGRYLAEVWYPQKDGTPKNLSDALLEEGLAGPWPHE